MRIVPSMTRLDDLRAITYLRQDVEQRKVDRINGQMRRLNREPDRWVDSDMTRDEWLLLAKQRAILAAAVTLAVIVVGIWCPW